MDLTTRYLGFELPHPLMPGASPLVDDLDTVRRLEDSGASAIVMHSLFEEQITREEFGMVYNVLAQDEAFQAAAAYMPRPEEFGLQPDRYLEQLRRIKEAVGVPVIGSLNGTTPQGWLSYAHQIEQAGADALELNFYFIATEADEDGAAVERRVVDILRYLRARVTIPLAVKLSPFFSSLPHLAAALDDAGAAALVLFNRFQQPDLDLDHLTVVPHASLSSSDDVLLRVRWLAILYGKVRAALAASGGVHTGADALKAVMAGASAVQLVSALLRHGPSHIAVVRAEMERWLEQHKYSSLRQAQGCMSLMQAPSAEAFERGHYMRVLQGWGKTTS